MEERRMDFQFFPSCCPPPAPVVPAARGRRLSILSQLLPVILPALEAAEKLLLSILSQLLQHVIFCYVPPRAAVFQFFPSCCGRPPPRLGRGSGRFQFFPSCCQGPQDLLLQDLARLSILSQLLPRSPWRALPRGSLYLTFPPFNSFPVAAVQGIRLGGSGEPRVLFQFFPSCCTSPTTTSTRC